MKRGAIVFVLLFLTASALGQTVTGIAPFTSQSSADFGSINLGSLNLHLEFPVINKAGRGLAFNYALTYDNSIWVPITVNSVTTWQPTTMWYGWSATKKPVGGYVIYKSTTLRCYPPGYPTEPSYLYQRYTYYAYVDRSGVTHPFGLVLDDDCSTNQSGTATATDSGITLSVVAGATSASIKGRDGEAITAPTLTASQVPTAPPSDSKDTNGNKITTTNGSAFTDTLGEAVLTISGTNPVAHAYANPAGSTSAVNVSFTTKTIKTNFQCSGIGEFGPTSVSLPTSIQYPDGTQYSINYETTPGYPSYVTGRIASITLPTGGQVAYTYSGGNNGIVCADGSTAGLTKTVTPGGTWGYTRSLVSGTKWLTTVIDPESNQTAINFQKTTSYEGITSYLETKRVVKSGSATVLKTIESCYNGALPDCTSTAIAGSISSKTVTIRLPDSSGKTSELYRAFNGRGLVTETREYDFGTINSGTRGSLLRKTVITYALLGNGIYDRPRFIQVYDGNDVKKAESEYIYDEGTVETTTAPQHDAVPGALNRGNLTTAKQLVSGTTNYLIRTYTYYDTGLVKSSKDINLAETNYTYDACGNAFVTQIALPLSLTRSFAWNCSGGVMTSSTDENDKTTTVAYTDAHFWRPRSSTDSASAVTTISYPNSTTVTSELNFNAGVSTIHTRAKLDQMGRPSLVQRKHGPSATTYDIAKAIYDSSGRSSGSSVPYSGSADSTSSTAETTTTFDGAGRPVHAEDAGGGTLDYTYTYSTVLESVGPNPANENVKQKQYQYDGLGKLMSVCEVTSLAGSGTCSQAVNKTGYWTRYTYNTLGNLIESKQNAQAAGNEQIRTFSYDMLGRMLSETNPETGTTTYTYDSVSITGCSSSSAGDLVLRTDAMGNKTCYNYDALHRVTDITYAGTYATNTDEKHFVYGTQASPGTLTYNGPTVTMQNTVGRLVRAYTGTAASKRTDIFYSYTARGEIVDIYQSTSTSGGNYYHVSGTYWESGQQKTQAQLKRATSAASSEVTIAGLPSFTFGVDAAGRPSTVSAGSGQHPVTATTYAAGGATPLAPSGYLTGVTYGSLDSDTFTFDLNTGQMKQYKYAVNGQNVIGDLTWNDNGSLKQLVVTNPLYTASSMTCNYLHDDLSRIASVDCPGKWQQTFTYDAFGNIRKLPGSSLAFDATYSAMTNQITTLPGVPPPSYDGNGNLTSDGTHTYSWNADGNAVNVDTVGVIYDAFGRTLERNNGGNYSRIIYGLRGEKIAIVSGANLINGYVALPASGTAVYTSSGLSFYRHPDWLGSARFASTPSRTMHYSRAFAPYGETNNGSSSVDRTFTGQNQDTVDGIYDFMFRRYDPTHGRWTSPDPAGIAAVDPAAPQSWNRYAYVGGNPLSAVDPLGLQPVYYVDGVMVAPGNFRGIMDSGAGMFCGSNCPAPVVLAKGGFAFPTVNVDGSVTWSVTDRAGNELTDAAMEEALGGYSLGTVATNRLFFFGGLPQSSGTASENARNARTSACIAKGLESTFAGSSIAMGSSTAKIGGHWNFSVQLQFSSFSAASGFSSAYSASSATGWPPPARFGSGAGPALHLKNLGGWSVSNGTYGIGGTVHIDLFNPNNGASGLAGHIFVDGLWGNVVQFFGGNIDPKKCPYR